MFNYEVLYLVNLFKIAMEYVRLLKEKIKNLT